MIGRGEIHVEGFYCSEKNGAGGEDRTLMGVSPRDFEAGDCTITYDDQFQAAENLVRQDTAKLGSESILVKSRAFKQLPLETFIQSPIIKEPY